MAAHSFSSLRFRLPVVFMVGAVVIALLTALITSAVIESKDRRRTEQALIVRAETLSKLYNEDREREPLLVTEQLTNTRIFVVFNGGPVPARFDGYPRLPSRVIDGKSHGGIFSFARAKTVYLAASAPLDVNGHRLGSIVVARSETDLHGELSTPLSEILTLFLLVVVIAVGFLGWVSRRMVKPLSDLVQATGHLASGSYEVEMPSDSGADEIGHLAQAFSGMASELARAHEAERQFLLKVSHELRSPLTAISGHAQALHDGVVSDPSSQQISLAVILGEADRLSRLVGDLLDLAKLQARRFDFEVGEVDLAVLVKRAYASFLPRARAAGIDYQLKIADEAIVIADGDRLLQAVMNLLANAFEWADGGEISIVLHKNGEYVEIAVSDNGPGMTEEEAAKSVRPFWSGSQQGTGIGLAITAEIVQAFEGRLQIESVPGKGSRFLIVLPVER